VKFSPNWDMDRRFSEALRRALELGVGAHAVKLEMFMWGLRPVGTLPIDLEPPR
jgi:sugar fermentation stimulation protein A